MMNKSTTLPVKIIIIHDDMDEDYPLVVMLKDKYSDENIFFKHSQEGLNFVLRKSRSKMVVLLDKILKIKMIFQFKSFEKIRKRQH